VLASAAIELGELWVYARVMNQRSDEADGRLMRLAQEKAFGEVIAQFRECPSDEVLAVADWLREDDIYNVAIELYQWLLDVDETAAAHFGIGQCYGKIYDYDAALVHLDEAFREDSQRSEGASYYAYILERHGRMEDADRWYRQALAGAESEDLWARSHYAWFLEKWGKSDAACRAYEHVLERNPAYTWAVKRYALLLFRLGEKERARELVHDAVERSPANRFAALNYLEFLLLTEDDGYAALRASMDPGEGPAWYPVMLDVFDYYREHLLTSRPDAVRLSALETAADSLNESVHRDFDDLTAMLAERGGDLDTWRRLIQLLLK
jgi:tetratricopeptide (TPR) repeat protein